MDTIKAFLMNDLDESLRAFLEEDSGLIKIGTNESGNYKNYDLVNIEDIISWQILRNSRNLGK